MEMTEMAQPSNVDKDKALHEKYRLRILAEKKTQATLQGMHKDFVGSINAYALVLVLLATVTYAGFLQPPGQTDSEGIMRNSTALQVFIYFNSFSFYLSVADLLLCVCSSVSPLTSINSGKDDFPTPASGGHVNLQSEQITTKHLSQFVASTLFKLICVNGIFAVSLVCCVAAFTAAGFSVTSSKGYHFLRGPRGAVLITSVIGVLFFCVFMVWLLRDTARFVSKALGDKSLSTSLQNRAGSLQVQFRYLNADESSRTALMTR